MLKFINNIKDVIKITQFNSKNIFYFAILFFLIVTIAIALLCIEYQNIKHGAKNRLATIAELQKIEINSWLKDQYDDAQLLAESPRFKFLFINFVKNQNQETYYNLHQLLDFYAKNNDISEILIVSRDGKIFFSLYKTIQSLSEEPTKALKKALADNKTVITDFHVDNSLHNYHVSLIQPINLNKNNKPNNFIILVSNATENIFPILDKWPRLSPSSSTLLLSKNNNLIFSFKKHEKRALHEILKYSKDVLPIKSIERKAIDGKTGFYLCKDINNDSIGGYITHISDTPWIIITKINKSEIFRRWYIILILSIIIFFIGLILFVSAIIISYKEQQKLYFQKLSHHNQEQLKIFERYKYIIQTIGSGIIMTDNSGKIEFMNTIAELLTGWNVDEAKGKHFLDVMNITSINNDDISNAEIFNSISEGKFTGDYKNSTLISKAGIEIPVNYHGTFLKSEDNNILGAIFIIEDQTKESFLNLINDIRLKFIHFSLYHLKDDFIKNVLHTILEITNSQVGCYISYIYPYQQITYNDLPNYYHGYCIEDNIECSVDYEKVWEECNKNKGYILNNTGTHYFYCEALLTSADHPRELFIPIFRNDKIVGIIGIATKNKDYTYIDISKLSILSDMVYEILYHKDTEEAYKNLVNLTNDLVCIADLKTTKFLMVNPSFYKTLGYSEEEIKSKSFIEFIHPDDKEKTVQVINEKLLNGEDVITFENRYLCNDGTYKWLDWNYHPVSSLGIVFASAHDITDRKNKEEMLLKSEKKFRELFIHSNDGICLHELIYDNFGNPVDYTIIDINPKYEEILGLKKDNVIGKRSIEIYPSETPPYFDLYKEVALTGNPQIFETFFEPLNKYFIISVFAPQKGQFATVFKDITQMKLAERELKEAEEKFSLFMKNLPLVVVIRDVNGRYIYLNDEWERVMELKKEDWLGKTPYDVFPKEDAEKLLQGDKEAIEKGKTEPIEFTLNHKSGVKWWMANRFIIYDANKKPAYVATLYIDITDKKKAHEERERLKEQLIQAQKLESIGRLAGGVAHDYNNMLEVILGNAQLALMQIDNKEDLKNYLQEITNAAKRSADITKQLLTFARKQISEPQVININTIIENMVKMLRRLIGEDIDLEWLLAPNLWNVFVDPIQINQIIANLCVNARDAIQSNGIITIKTKNIVINDTYCADKPDCLPGEYVMISVIDNGIGIDSDIIDKIFEPFFTTKEIGKGTGLGLSTVYGIVKQNNGFINVYSEKGKGSTFNIYLPRYIGKDELSKESATESWFKGNGEVILVVEDEISLLKMIQIMLERLNYKVITANTPAEALNIVKLKGESLQLVLTDFVMPVMDGLQLSEEIKKLNPDIQFVYMSGYTDRIFYDNKMNKETNFLQKPFSITELARKIRDALEKK